MTLGRFLSAIACIPLDGGSWWRQGPSPAGKWLRVIHSPFLRAIERLGYV